MLMGGELYKQQRAEAISGMGKDLKRTGDTVSEMDSSGQ